MMEDFAIFILTHGRPDEQHTLNTLLKAGYSGKYFLVLDDQDDAIQKYIDNFGANNIYVFDKNHYINNMDVGTNNPPFKSVVYAKNAAEDIAKQLGLKAFVLADDDIVNFRFRWAEGDSLKSSKVRGCVDIVMEEYVNCILNSKISMSSFGGFVHYYFGAKSLESENLQRMRIPFNFVFRNSAFNVDWVAGFGEDVVTAIRYNKLGYNCMVLPQVEIDVKPFATGGGGMLETYKSMSDLKRAEYYHIYYPDCIDIGCNKKSKIVPVVNLDTSVPKIISEKYKHYS